uniref:DUF8207 domain-containing protein n=1 Tax=Cotesia sesamiae Mombasa bracovirus TaxID=452649 RepID=R9XLH4_9VIRU|nr:hypothetical protein CsmBAC4b19.4 [Cotesia sesamiae] [Cotesia sesamiae Mombasa bracovirus]
MEYNKPKARLPVINFDQIVQGTGVKKVERHGALLPNSICAVFCGPSNCGKTNALLSLIVHPNSLSFCLCQTYKRIPKHLIRDNTNFFVLFRQDEMNLKDIYDDHVNTDMSYNSFRDLCSARSNKYGFVVIDKDSEGDSEEKPQIENQEVEKSLYDDPEVYNSLMTDDKSSFDNTALAITQLPPSTSTPARRNPLLTNYLQRLSKKHKDNDMRYGVRRKHGEMHKGDSPISFANDTITLKKNYPIIPGLLELLFRKLPEGDALITPDNKKKYLDIIQHTNTHRKNYDPNRTIYEDTTIKFNKYIADFITKFGKGLPKYMIAKKQRLPMAYVYWDDPNELVDHLRLLIASEAAGNPSHSNEIMSIIEELREAGVIY